MKTRKTVRPGPLSYPHSWGDCANSVWLATTLCLHRNVDKFHFPHKLDSFKRDSVSELILQGARNAPALEGTLLPVFSFDELHPLHREYVSEHFLIFQDIINDLKGRTVLTDISGEIALQINFSDHIQLHILDLHGELEKSLEKLIAIERHIEKKLPLAFSQNFGYLTSDPTSCGTGLVARAYLHLPATAIRETLSDFCSRELQESVSYAGLQGRTSGSSSDFVGDIAVLSNRWTVGVTEEMILSSIRAEAMKCAAHEAECRIRIKEEKNSAAIDLVSRAVGTLKHAYSIDTSEALRRLSLIKFGIEIGWISGASIQEVNQRLLSCRRAHLAESLGLISHEKSSEYQEPERFSNHIHAARAELLRKWSLNLSINIP